ncbi:MAG TPA: hypothetical protein VG389_17595 [Myxococcota bacterium]|jgi:hypothetical protein|nr:hypothetical protein [Myxococcota bacterium]
MERHAWQREGRHWVLIAAVLLAACGPRHEAFVGVNAADRTLIAAVRAAAAAGARAEEVEALVGSKAVLNSAREGTLMRVYKHWPAHDPEAPSEVLDLDGALQVVLWKRPVKARIPRLVGIQWPRSGGSPTVFFGIVYDP